LSFQTEPMARKGWSISPDDFAAPLTRGY
jgi:hypothetical protein